MSGFPACSDKKKKVAQIECATCMAKFQCVVHCETPFFLAKLFFTLPRRRLRNFMAKCASWSALACSPYAALAQGVDVYAKWIDECEKGNADDELESSEEDDEFDPTHKASGSGAAKADQGAEEGSSAAGEDDDLDDLSDDDI